MAYSFNTTIASGSTQTISVPFPYLDKSHVHVTINTVAVADSTLSWDNDHLLRLPSAPAPGSVIKAYRDTPKDVLSVVFDTPSIFEGDSMNLALTQLLYIAQEAYDQGVLPQEELDAAIFYVNQTATAAQASADLAQLKVTACQAALTACLAAQTAAENARDAAEEITGLDLTPYMRKSDNLAGLNAATARANIGAAALSDITSTVVRYDAAQSLDSTQKATARSNIGALSSSGGTVSGNLTVSGSFTVNGAGGATMYGYGDDNNKSRLAMRLDGSRSLTYGVGGDFYQFNGAHVYSAAGRLYGTNDFSSVIASLRWVSAGTYNSSGWVAYPFGASGFLNGFTADEATGVTYYGRYLQMQISGTWYTVGAA